MVENPDQKPKDKQLQTKPAELQRVLPPHHLHIRDLGQERSVFPVSTWPVTASLKDASTSARQRLTTLIAQGQVPLSPKSVSSAGLGFVEGAMAHTAEHERNREMLLPPKIHTSATLAHCISVHIVMSAISFSHIPNCKSKIHDIQNRCIQLCLHFFSVTLGKLCAPASRNLVR